MTYVRCGKSFLRVSGSLNSHRYPHAQQPRLAARGGRML